MRAQDSSYVFAKTIAVIPHKDRISENLRDFISGKSENPSPCEKFITEKTPFLDWIKLPVKVDNYR